MRQPRPTPRRTNPLERISGLITQADEATGGLLGSLPFTAVPIALNRAGIAAGQGDYAKVAEELTGVIPAGRLVTRAIRGVTGGLSDGEVGGARNVEAPQQAALDQAQRNAALPRSQGGLGLPPDNTPMDRARAMGYTTPAYIGRNEDFPAYDVDRAGGKTFGTGAWSSSNPAVANTYVTSPSGNVMPALLNTGASMQVDAKGSGWNRVPLNARANTPERNVVDRDAELLAQLGLFEDAPQLKTIPASRMSVGDMLGIDKMYEDSVSTDEIARFARQNQLDSAQISNVIDVGPSGRFMTEQARSPSSDYVVFDPSRIRSRFAAFDPMRRNEADLLALNGGQQAVNLPNFERLFGLLEE